MARPRVQIDWKLFEGFCQMQCTLWEIASYFNCSEDTVERRVREKYGVGFAEYFAKKRIAGLMSLRRNLLRMSEKKPAVAIFLAKNWLGMSDKQEVEHSGKDGKPIVAEIRVISEAGKSATLQITGGEGTD